MKTSFFGVLNRINNFLPLNKMPFNRLPIYTLLLGLILIPESFAQTLPCNLPYTCNATGWKCDWVEQKFTIADYLTKLNNGELEQCNEPHYSTSSYRWIYCNTKCIPLDKWCKDESGVCVP